MEERKSLCDHQYDTISCISGYLKIINATYGRSSSPPPGCTSLQPAMCGTRDIVDFMKERCEGKKLCNLFAHPRSCKMDPCRGYSNVLEVGYRCVSDATTKRASLSTSIAVYPRNSEGQVINHGVTLGAVIIGTLLLLAIVTLVVLHRRKGLGKPSGLALRQATPPVDAITAAPSETAKDDPEGALYNYITPATLPTDGDYEEPDRPVNETRQPRPLPEVPGYQLVHPQREAAYADYNISHQRQLDTESYIMKEEANNSQYMAIPGSPQTAETHLKEEPGYQTVKNLSSAVAASKREYMEYEVSTAAKQPE